MERVEIHPSKLRAILFSIDERIRTRRKHDFRIPEHQFDSVENCYSFIRAMSTSGVPRQTLEDDISTLWRMVEMYDIDADVLKGIWNEISVYNIMME